MIKIKNHAPIIIPTLNRYEHFKNCVESLSKNIGADKTVLYVGLDYPAKESHIEGYKKIKNYLSTHNLKFKEFYVFERDQNLGVGANGNADKLLREVSEKHDRYIFTEDDNIFSPYFLQYINWGLSEYETDPSVMAICGYTLPIRGSIPSSEAILFRNYSYFSAWGYGGWIKKYNEMSIINSRWAKSILMDSRLLDKVIDNGPSDLLPTLIDIFHHNDKNPVWITDRIITLYTFIQNKYTISPIYSKVKNCGWDGSGNSMNFKGERVLEKADPYIIQEIDINSDSIYIVASEEYSVLYSRQISDSFIYDQEKRKISEKKLDKIFKIGITNYYAFLKMKQFTKNILKKYTF